MRLDQIVAWYQKKIGTYDKQQWEKTVEQKILSGFTNVTLKNTKLKTELIDVDLVRGSTFPKAKPKQSLVTVIKFAILRYFFLPIYAKWWVSQTSPKIFILLLGLYATQLINWAVYSFHVHNVKSDGEHIVSLSELLIPMALSLILSFIHSQIVATNSANNNSTKRKRILTTTGKPRERVRRRKKLLKMRSEIDANYLKYPGRNARSRSGSVTSLGGLKVTSMNKNSNVQTTNVCENANKIENVEIPHSKSAINTFIKQEKDVMDVMRTNNSPVDDSKKRNVNWDSPIHNYANLSADELDCSKREKSNVSSVKTKTVRIDDCIQEFYDDLIQHAEDEIAAEQIEEPNNVENVPNLAEQTGEDDGFESFNGKSSSGDENPPQGHSSDILGHSKVESISNADNSLPAFRNQLRYRFLTRSSSTTQESRSSKDANEEHEMKSSSDLCDGTSKASSAPLQGFRKKFPLSSESDIERNRKFLQKAHAEMQKKGGSTATTNRANDSSETDEEGDDGEVISSPTSLGNATYTECTTSATEWLGITTNSEDCYSSELDNSDFQHNFSDDGLDHDFAPTVILNPSCGSSDRISCTIWEHREVKKAEMSVLDISSCIIERVEAMPESYDYLYIGVSFSILLTLIPVFCRLCEATDLDNPTEINYLEIPLLLWEKASFSFITILIFAFGETNWEKVVLTISFLQRFCLTFLMFFLFAVAERTFKQRFLYAKLFSHLTSSRRAQKSDLPHFRLNKVRNIKTWLSVRSYLKRRGPQRSVDVIVSAAFIITLLLLAFLSVEWLKDSVQLHSQFNLEALMWSTALGIFLLRFMTLGNKINRKYRSISVLITEQINLYLQIEQKPKKKEELMVSNSVLKLAGDLLKELESPFKISGLSANPYLYTTIKVVILSALSGVLSEMLGFKLKLHKIKIK